MSEERLTRIAIVSEDKCKPRKCHQECKRSCPVNRMGKLCIEVLPDSKISSISEELCIGCGICVKKCPFEAISIINIPTNLEKETTHRYSANSFKLHRLPVPRPGQVLGLVGTNGIGKSTALKILANKLKPNLGKFATPPDWKEILQYFRGSELQNYFTKMLEDNLKAVTKPQYVEQIPRSVRGKVSDLLAKMDERGAREEYIDLLELRDVLDRDIDVLSGGELQRFAIAVACVRKADVYMFDEPSSYLDVKQRLAAAQAIRSLVHHDNYVIVVEHDLSVLDYLSDFICVLYGVPSAYGVVTMPSSVREGINNFLDGRIPSENLRFREEALQFRLMETADDVEIKKERMYEYPHMTKTMTQDKGGFKLTVESGKFTDSEIIVMLGQNGMGKTTFIRMLAGAMKPDDGQEVPSLNVSYKPQKIVPSHEGTVRSLLLEKIRSSFLHPQFNTDVIKPLQIEKIIDQEVKFLSGGELQRVAICLCLGKPADIYLIDEPSAYLDSEQRVIAAKVIKRFILHAKKTAFVVEHDFIMATYLADRVIVYEGTPSVAAVANSPQPLLSGMNRFLSSLQITFRRDPTNFRPRINKMDSVKDKEQKESGQYFFLEKAYSYIEGEKEKTAMNHFPGNWGKPRVEFSTASSSSLSSSSCKAQLSQDNTTHTTSPIVTGTSVLGIVYSGGVMLAADCLASYGSLARFRDMTRISPISPSCAFAASGEVSDYAAIKDFFKELTKDEFCWNDGHSLTASQYHTALQVMMYKKRTNMTPLWNSVIVAGFENDSPFLGYVDLKGTSYKGATSIATGYGAYIAQPLLRKATDGRSSPLSESEAKELLEACMRVLYYRDARSLNKIQLCKIDKNGVQISEPYELDTDWSVAMTVRGYA